jgi:cytochrome c oxidase cbb3-type subunit IV
MTTKPISAEETIVPTDYAFFAHFAQTWGLVYFVLIFIAVLVYALWPSRQKQFDESARVPLRED